MIPFNNKPLTILALALCLIFVPMSQAQASIKTNFIHKLLKQDIKKVTRISRDLDMSAMKKALPDAAQLGKRLNIPQEALQSPALRKMAIVGEEIAMHGKFGNQLINQSQVPELVIKQYSRYGKGEYLEVAKTVGQTMRKPSPETLGVLSKLKSKYKGMNNVINNFNRGKYDDDIFVRLIRKTGKHGKNTLSWMVKNLKMAGIGAAMAWYLYDPEGFESTLTQSGETLGGFIGTLVGTTVATVAVTVPAKVAEATNSGLGDALEKYSQSSTVSGALGIAFVLLLFFNKTFRRVLFFPLKIIGIQANNKMNQMEDNHTVAPAKTPIQRNRSNSSGNKPRSNL